MHMSIHQFLALQPINLYETGTGAFLRDNLLTAHAGGI